MRNQSSNVAIAIVLELKRRCIKTHPMRIFRYCSVIRPENNMLSCRMSLFTFAKLCLIVILLTGSLVQTKKKTYSKLQLNKFKNSNSKLRSTLNQIEKSDDKTFQEIACASSWIKNSHKKKSIQIKSLLPLTKKELSELIRDIAVVYTGKYKNSDVFYTEKNYEIIKNKLELFGYLSKPTVYAPEDELYKQMWKSFEWRDPFKGFETPQDAQKIIKELDASLSSSSSKLTLADIQVLPKFFQKQPLYFDTSIIPKMDKFPTFPAATYNFLRNFKFTERLKYLMRGMSVVEAIEDAQTMLSFEPSGWQYRLRHLNTTTLNLEKCSFTDVGANPIDCGEPIDFMDKSRIIGGTPSQPGSWPWMALLKISSPKNASLFSMCGGVLISERHILTAAHCVDRTLPENVRVYMGEYDIKKFKDSTTVLERVAESIFVYESYNLTGQMENDIALIKLKINVPFSRDYRHVCLPPPDINTEGKNGYIVGWGSTSERGQASHQLLEAIVPIWEDEKCHDSISYNTNKKISTARQLCAGLLEGGIDTCQGDSGGPLMYQSGAGQWITVGVVSWGKGCARPDLPGVYTRVSSYLDWINPKLLL